MGAGAKWESVSLLTGTVGVHMSQGSGSWAAGESGALLTYGHSKSEVIEATLGDGLCCPLSTVTPSLGHPTPLAPPPHTHLSAHLASMHLHSQRLLSRVPAGAEPAASAGRGWRRQWELGRAA